MSNEENTRKEAKVFKLSDLLSGTEKNDRFKDLSEEDLETLAQKYGNINYFFMFDCIQNQNCPIFGLCSTCFDWDRTLVLNNGVMLHYNEDTLGFTFDGGFAFRFFIAHDGRLYSIKEEQILLDRRNHPSEKDIEELNQMSEERDKHIKKIKKEFIEKKKEKDSVEEQKYGYL